ncbi:MAG: hypothetical protein V4451_17370 [Pseudomonadota bacterium]
MFIPTNPLAPRFTAQGRFAFEPKELFVKKFFIELTAVEGADAGVA